MSSYLQTKKIHQHSTSLHEISPNLNFVILSFAYFATLKFRDFVKSWYFESLKFHVFL